MQEIVVELADRSYPVQVGGDLWLGNRRLAELASGRSVAIVTDTNVDPLYGAALERDLRAHAYQVVRIVLPAGESNKDWPTLNRIFDRLLGERFDRRSLLVALGGGVVGDMTGFAAACYQRGVDFVQVPTTLLAQVDSSVGGKTAINHPLGKNMIGAFHQPRLVIADVALLGSLPARELSAGLAEVIKHGAIVDPAYLAEVEASMTAMRRVDVAALTRAVAGSVRIKAGVVAGDEREGGVRAILNFGHTFGHAIEAGAGYGQWLHGEAVGVGMVMAADLSARIGPFRRDDVERLRAVIAQAGLPVKGPGWPASRYLELMAVDKKADKGMPRFIILDSIGSARITAVDPAPVAETLGAHTG